MASLGAMVSRPVLVVQHEEQCPPGRVGAWLTEQGLTLDVRHPYAGHRLPGDLVGHSGLVVLGGHMSALDDATYPWLSVTKARIREAATRGIPTLGVCLGHQLAAVALGGEVQPNPAGKRRGVLDMGWVPAAAEDPLLGGCGDTAVQWHRDIVTRIPPGTVELGRAGTGELLAARFAPSVWGVQSHPEADAEIVRVWARFDLTAAGSAAEHAAVDDALAQVTAADAALGDSWRSLGVAFASAVATAEARRPALV